MLATAAVGLTDRVNSELTLDDAVRQARAGSGEALAELYHRFADSLLVLARHLTGSIEDAEDVVHDVFVGLPEALRRYEEHGSFEVWLRRVTVRTALMSMRRSRRRSEEQLEGFPECGRSEAQLSPPTTWRQPFARLSTTHLSAYAFPMNSIRRIRYGVQYHAAK